MQVSATLRRPGIRAGAVVGAMLTAALIAVLYAGWALWGLPFVAYDVFDWVSRILPGPLLTFGIDTMVGIIRGLGIGPTSVVAKAAEHAMAILGLFVTGIFAGAILFGILRGLRGRYAYGLGVLLGLVVGITVLVISLRTGQTASVGPALSALWVLVAFVVWGVAFGWAYTRLAPAPAVAGVGEPAVGGAPSAPPTPAPPTAEQMAVQRLNRRQFLIRLGGATAVITVAGAVVGELAQRQRQMAALAGAMDRWSATHPLPNAGAEVQPVPGTRPEFTPLEQHYRIDINTTPPTINEAQWRLRVAGLVDEPLSLSLEDLRRYEPLHQFITLACISNPVGGDLTSTTRWTGVSLQRLLADWRLKPAATHLMIRSADGFFEVVPLETIRGDPRVMLTYAWDGVPLPADHGFPLRIYIPDHYGMKQPKWIQSIEATDHWEPGYWVVRGWDKNARMKATSVIDTVGVNMMIIGAGEEKRMLVPIGGIAHAGARGISKVEVRVDDGPWEPAKLRAPLSDLTWVIWRYEWPFQGGQHTFTVRCYEGSGTPQIATPAPVRPDGAAGLDSRSAML